MAPLPVDLSCWWHSRIEASEQDNWSVLAEFATQ